MKLTAYGSRASMPFFSKGALKGGGNTSCYRVDMNGRTIILDCGTGIMQFHSDMLKERAASGKSGLTFDILISHLHLDHIIGLSMFDFLFDKANNIRIFTRSRSGLPLESQIFGIFKPPYWPIDIAKMNNAGIFEIKGGDNIDLGDGIDVKVFDSMHDNDTSGFRLEGEKTLVYLLDYEIDKNSDDLPDLVEFCKNADAVVFDATYLPEDYPKRRGWGHSTFEAGMMLAEMARCKRMIFSHFFHIYDDDTLDSIMRRVKSQNSTDIEYFAATDGLELNI